MRALAALLLIAVPAFGQAPTRGYVGRPNGYDLDQDGVVGEAGVDDLICDDTSGTGWQTEVLWAGTHSGEQVYVDCDAGSDSNTGGPSDPYLTLLFAESQLDGPGDGVSDVICFTGTCAPDGLVITVDGVTGFWTDTASGSEARDWQYPSRPLVISGWDKDNDNSYPPFDTDDTSIMDGTFTLDTALDPRTGNRSYWEFSHFTAKSYGTFGGAVDQFFLDNGTGSHTFVHDIVLVDIMKDGLQTSQHIVFDLFVAGSYQSYENLLITDYGGYLFRGTGALGQGPWRFKNITATAHGCDTGSPGCADVNGAGTVCFKVWNPFTGVEILDSLFDSNLAAWNPAVSSGTGAICIGPTQCTQDWTIRNNKITDYKVGILIDGGECPSNQQKVDDMVVDGNEIVVETDYFSAGSIGVQIGNNYINDEQVADVTITNNLFVNEITTTSQRAAFLYDASGQTAAQTAGEFVKFNGNTINWRTRTGLGVIETDTDDGTDGHDTWEFQNNLFYGVVAADLPVLDIDMDLADLTADYSAYDTDSDWDWRGSADATLAAWRTTTSEEANSSSCDASVVGGGNYHLQGGDTCAKDIGPTSPCPVTTDADQQTRPINTNCDAGMDEEG